MVNQIFNPNQIVEVTEKSDQDECRIFIEELFEYSQRNPDNYSTWEDDFIYSLSDWQNAFTEKQMETIKRIYEKHGFVD